MENGVRKGEGEGAETKEKEPGSTASGGSYFF